MTINSSNDAMNTYFYRTYIGPHAQDFIDLFASYFDVAVDWTLNNTDHVRSVTSEWRLFGASITQQ